MIARSELNALFSRLDDCRSRDRRRLRSRLISLQRSRPRKGAGSASPPALDALASDIERSVRAVQRRRERAPKPRYPAELPVSARRDEIRELIAKHQVVVVCGETGSGKTTQLPKICLELGLGARGMIAHTQPRRIAARAVAARIAEELERPLGDAVGYKIRFADKTTPATMIKVMTDGVLLAETQRDRRLEAYDAIIIDEAHERSLNIDFLLGILRRLLPRRPDLKIIITSATIDPERFSEMFDAAPIITVSGRAYPVEIRHEPPAPADSSSDDLAPLIDHTVSACVALLRDPAVDDGDLLVFMPGEREIRLTAKGLRDRFAQTQRAVEILPLYARLSNAEQQRVFAAHDRRRIVIATNVAETSLTVPGIRAVVDPGVARLNRYSARTKTQRLQVEPVSKASAKQRAGRCGRVAPGVCVRLYSAEDEQSRPEFTDPEILRANLAGVILQMKSLELGEIEQFPFLDPPDRRIIRDALDTLRELDAIDDHEKLTDMGRDLAKLPIDPRIGRMLLAGAHEGALAETLVIVAALSIQDPRERPLDRRGDADLAHSLFADERSDFVALLNLWKAYHEAHERESRRGLEQWCRKRYLSVARMREWRDTHRQLRDLLGEMGLSPNRAPASYDATHRALLAGMLGSIGVRTEGAAYLGPRGLSFHVHPASALFTQKPRWIMAAELVRTTKLYARLVAKIQPEWIERVAARLVRRDHSDPHYRERSVDVGVYEKVSLFGLSIIPKRETAYGPVNPGAAREMFIHHALVDARWSLSAPFMAHNAALREEIEQMEARLRRRDLLADAERRFAFFDARIPSEVWSGELFEGWRRRAERENAAVLFMDRADLLAPGAETAAAESFPTEARIGRATLDLEYRVEPGHDADGVTLSIPVAALAQVDPVRCEWMPAGREQEKVAALIKTLPKEWRRLFVPAPDTALRCLESITPGQAPIAETIARKLSELSKLDVPPDLLRTDQLPAHLRMNFRVIDLDGAELGAGRDLRALQRDLAPLATERLQSLAGPALLRDGLTEWEFDELPERLTLGEAPAAVTVHPAIVDQGSAVGVRVFGSLAQAQRRMRQGVRALLAMQLRREFGQTPESLPGFDRMALLYATIGPAAELAAGLERVIAEHAYLPEGVDPWSVRTHGDFLKRLEHGWNTVAQATTEISRLVESTLEQRQAALERLNAAAPDSAHDEREHLARLTPSRFLERTPIAWLWQFPRYLRASTLRLERLERASAQRDQARLAELRPYMEALAPQWSRLDADDPPPALESYRWALEEMRVSLFAQELGTSIPISFKRLEALRAASGL